MEENNQRYRSRNGEKSTPRKRPSAESRQNSREFEDFDTYAMRERRQRNRAAHMQREKERRSKAKRRRNIVIIAAVVCLLFVGGFAATLSLLGGEETAPAETNVAATDGESSPKVEKTPEEPVAEEETTAAMGTISSDYERVINRTYPIPADYVAGSGELVSIEGKQLEKNAAASLEQMLSAMRNEGLSIILQSAYRTDSDQEYLYNRQIGRQGGDEIKAATISAVPLTSEHQVGLAVDLSVDGTLTEDFGSTAQGQWLAKHCVEYGFIERYPKNKETVTGIIWEPWHFRYVGSADVAQKIMASGLCMEEYYGKPLASEDIDPYLPYLQ